MGSTFNWFLLIFLNIHMYKKKTWESSVDATSETHCILYLDHFTSDSTSLFPDDFWSGHVQTLVCIVQRHCSSYSNLIFFQKKIKCNIALGALTRDKSHTRCVLNVTTNIKYFRSPITTTTIQHKILCFFFLLLIYLL